MDVAPPSSRSLRPNSHLIGPDTGVITAPSAHGDTWEPYHCNSAAPRARGALQSPDAGPSRRAQRPSLAAPYKHRTPLRHQEQPYWSRLPLHQSAGGTVAPCLLTCPYRFEGNFQQASGSGDAGFDQRWMRLPFEVRRYAWQVSARGLAKDREAVLRLPIVTLDCALTLCFAVWAGGNILYVPSHWQSSTWRLSSADETILTQFLGQLCNTADFRHPIAQQTLLERLDHTLAAMQADAAFAERILHLMDLPLSSCFDTLALTFNDIGLVVIQHEMTAGSQDLEETGWMLRRLGLGLMRLHVVREHSLSYWLKNQFVDQIEVSLKFEVLLARRLDLPVVTQRWLYAQYVAVDDRVLAAAARGATEAVNDWGRVESFFADWEPWQLHQKKLMAAQCNYDRLPIKTWLDDPEALRQLICTITQESYDALAQPVFMGRRHAVQVYEFAALLQWYCKSDEDPNTREHFDLTSLYRLYDPRRDAADT